MNAPLACGMANGMRCQLCLDLPQARFTRPAPWLRGWQSIQARLTPQIGREEAHRLVERAAGEVRRTGEELQAVLTRLAPIPFEDAFEFRPAIEMSGAWVDRAVAEAASVRNTFSCKR